MGEFYFGGTPKIPRQKKNLLHHSLIANLFCKRRGLYPYIELCVVRMLVLR